MNRKGNVNLKTRMMENEKLSISKIRELMKSNKIGMPFEVRRMSFGDRAEILVVFRALFSDVLLESEYKHYPAYDEVIDWMVDNDNKGLLLTGNKGTGKTIIIRQVITGMIRGVHGKVVRTYNPRTLSVMTRDDFFEILKRPTIILDDIGREGEKVEFGNRFDPVVFAIEEAYDSRKILIISTNLTFTELTARYGDHITDRLKEICRIVPIEGKSMR